MDKPSDENEIRCEACALKFRNVANAFVRSLSLNESNDLRAKLGLAPLRAKKEVQLGNSATSYRSRADLAAEEAQREQLQARLSSAKRARETAAANSTEADSNAHAAAIDWVASMRQRKAARKTGAAAALPAQRRGTLQADTEDDAEGGIAVRHAVDDFQEGHSVVLTLADTDVLAEDGDVLQNSQMMEQAKSQLANARKGKLAKARGGSSYSRVGSETGGMLSRWEEGDAQAVTGTRTVLTASGALVPSAVNGDAGSTADSAAADAVRDRLQAAAAQGTVRMASDFMTAEEAHAALPQPQPQPRRSKAGKSKKHKRNKHSRVQADDDAPPAPTDAFFTGTEGSLGGAAGAGAAMAAALLASSASAPATVNRQGAPLDQADVAAAKAKLMSAAPAGGGVNPLTKQRTYRHSGTAGTGAGASSDEEGEDNSAAWSTQLFASLARAKAASSAGPAVPSLHAGGGEGGVDVAAVAARLTAARAAREAAKAAQAAENPGAASSALVFSSTDEFKRRMEAARANAAAAGRSATATTQQASTHDAGGVEGDLDQQLADAQVQVAEAQADGSLTADEGGAGGGVGSTLAFLRRTGALKPVKSRAQIAGRANDKLMDEGDDPAPGIQLKYHDAFGREMTTKEAFRHLNYKFHGYGSGKGKRDKKLEAYMDSVQASKRS